MTMLKIALMSFDHIKRCNFENNSLILQIGNEDIMDFIFYGFNKETTILRSFAP